jgi:hypothetical protein
LFSRLLGRLRSLHIHDLPVAVAAPLVEIIPARSLVNFVFRVIAAVHLDHLASFNLGAAVVG